MALCSDWDVLLVFAKMFPFVMFKKDLKQQKITVTENKFSLFFFTYLRKNFIHLPNKQKNLCSMMKRKSLIFFKKKE